MRALGTALLLLLGGCNSCRSSTPQIVDAGPEPAKPEGPTFSVVAIVNHGWSDQMFRLRDGVAIAQHAESGWNVVTLGKGKPMVDLTAKLPRNGKDHVRDLWGTTDEVWITTHEGKGFHATRASDPTPAGVYRFVIPSPEGSWLGVPAHQPLTTPEFGPSRFERIGAADIPVPPIPEAMRPRSLVALPNHRYCGVSVTGSDELRRIWTWDESGNSSSIPDPNAARVFRSADSECLIVGLSEVLTIDVLRGGTLFGLGRSDRAATDDPGALDVTNNGTALWVADTERYVHRLDLTTHPAKRTTFPISAAGVCDIHAIQAIVALADDDVWLYADCNDGERIVLHTEPAPSAVAKMPVP